MYSVKIIYTELPGSGQKHGLQRIWYSNGKLSYENNYKHNRQHGLQRSWTPNGKLTYELNYHQGTMTHNHPFFEK